VSASVSGTRAETINIASTLTDRARERPFAPAVHCPAGHDRNGRSAYVTWSFRRLDRESDALARGLTHFGIGPGVRTVLMVKPSLEFFALTFALFKAGAVPVLIDPGMGIKNLGRCLDEAAPEAFIGIPQAQLARRVLGWAKRTLKVTVTLGRQGRRTVDRAHPTKTLTLSDVEAAGASNAPFPIVATQADDLAAILFTSGSTGPPKGAEYSHAIFSAQVDMLRSLYAIEPGEIDLCTFPLFALFAPALGMTSVIPVMDATRPARVDPVEILEPIETFGVTNLFGSPALLKRVAEFGSCLGAKLPSLRRVVSAGAPVPARVLERFASMLAPGVQVFTPYGATESLPVASIGSDEILGDARHATDRGAGVCVGRPVDGMRVEVIGIRDEAIPRWSDELAVPEGQIGEIVVSGPVATRAYFRREEATRLAKINGPDGTVLHRMGDVGYLDGQGRLWFCGRKAHRVETEQGTLFTIPCEAVFNTHAAVNRSALVGVGPAGRARPVLCVELVAWPSKVDRERITRELLVLGSQHQHTSGIKTVLFHRSFPVDIRHNAKIFREKLAAWAARRVP
jgi:acyl-CoA synthetase (AMP-forming)/AMP-acid ligase II